MNNNDENRSSTHKDAAADTRSQQHPQSRSSTHKAAAGTRSLH